MVARLQSGPRFFPSNQDKDGYRTYKVAYVVSVEANDGPAVVYDCPGLPAPGSFYQYGNDVDNFAWCYWAREVSPMGGGEEFTALYLITLTFSTKPEDLKRCRESRVEDPLLEPPKISGSFAKYTEEATRDRFNRPIVTSSFEQIRGPQNEWDRNRGQVKIEQNVLSAYQGYVLPENMLDHVNAFPLWGLPARTIKLSAAPWEKKYYGSCFAYYTRTLEFEIRWALTDDGTYETWDRDLLDEGTKVLQGVWGGNSTVGLTYTPQLQIPGGGTPNPRNPTHFMKAVDPAGQPMKMVLNGAGLPASVMAPNGTLFASIQNGNVGNNLSNGSFWVPIIGDPTNVPAWVNFAVYDIGWLASVGGTSYVSIADNVTDSPPSANWSVLTTNAGTYNAGTTYTQGQYVSGVSFTGNPGKIHVEKYPSADFALLGIPLIF